MFDELNGAIFPISENIDAKLFIFEKDLLGGPMN
jgi:hypothetical protein